MKRLVILSVLIVASCGKVEVNREASRVGESRSTNPVTVPTDVVTRICQSLSQKTPSSLVGTQAIFSNSRKGCDDENLSAAVDIITTIQNNGSYVFVQGNGLIPYFGGIETLDKGSMSPICNQLTSGTLVSPIQNGNEFTYYSTSAINPADCDAKLNEVCIEIARASSSGTDVARVHTKEWIRFNTDTPQGRVGFFTLKKQVTAASCPEGKTIVNSALLK